MVGRDPGEIHRAATPLELLFDLVFVVAVAFAAGGLHHGIAEGHVGDAVVSYAMVFFAIWWAWMNFTWFASAFDTDDVPYRLAVLVQLAGSLILAAGIPRAFDERDFGIVTLGYVVMRLALVGQWLRAAHADRPHRRTARRFAAGVALCQVGWVLLLVVPSPWFFGGFVLLVVAELAVPAWAERAGATPWHAEHIAERYGLFTIIVLGESILSATVAAQATIDDIDLNGDLTPILLGGLLVVFAMWWLYFDRHTGALLSSLRATFVWGYGHLPIWAATAAVGAGLAVAVDQATGHAEIGVFGAGAAVAWPVAVFLVGVWVLEVWRHPIPSWSGGPTRWPPSPCRRRRSQDRRC
jgi:low temperature requirement protein LtrA